MIALCRTSNPGSADLQSLDCGGEPLYVRVAAMVADEWTRHGECGLVVGATYPDELAVVREVVGDLPILVPGVGAQGGDAIGGRAGRRHADGRGLVVSSSRSILYAVVGDDFAAAARAATIDARGAHWVIRNDTEPASRVFSSTAIVQVL